MGDPVIWEDILRAALLFLGGLVGVTLIALGVHAALDTPQWRELREDEASRAKAAAARRAAAEFLLTGKPPSK